MSVCLICSDSWYSRTHPSTVYKLPTTSFILTYNLSTCRLPNLLILEFFLSKWTFDNSFNNFQELATCLESQATLITNLQAQLSAIFLSNTRSRPVLPDLVKFDGKAYHFDKWLLSIKAKLRVDGAAFGDSIAQFYYVYDRLESTAQSVVLPQLIRRGGWVWSFQTSLDQLVRAYENLNKT